MKRLDTLKKLLKETDLDGILISNPSNIYYMSGVECDLTSQIASFSYPEFFLLCTQKTNLLLTDPRYAGIKNNAFKLEIINQKDKTYPNFIKNNIKRLKIKRLGVEMNFFDHNSYTSLSRILKGIKIQDTSDLIQGIRQFKTNDEISLMRESQSITDSVFKEIIKLIKPGVTEIFLANKIKELIRKECEIAFEPIVAAGKNSAVPHHKSTTLKIGKNDIVLIDMGAKYKGYCSDMTRTVFVGKPEYRAFEIYRIVNEARRIAEDHALAKRNISEIDVTVRNYFKKFDLEDKFTHSLGHGVGIDIHENPSIHYRSKLMLEKGNVITIEPGIYLKNKFGIRIENMLKIGNKNSIFSKISTDLIRL